MKAIVCEMCGGNDLIKQDGYFVCQHCGTKYTLEEAKKLLIDGTVNVKVDETENIVNLLKRANLALEDRDFSSANRFAEKALDIDAECGEAYWIKALSELKCVNYEEIARINYTDSANYKKAVKFADDDLKQIINNLQKEKIYLSAKENLMDLCNDVNYKQAKELLNKLDDYKDSKLLLQNIDNEKEEQIKYQQEIQNNLPHTMREIDVIKSCVSYCGGDTSAFLKLDGTVFFAKHMRAFADALNWTDIVAISSVGSCIVGLKKDGTVVAVGDNLVRRIKVSDWKDIVAVSAGLCHTVGLTSYGTVVAVGDNEKGQCNVSKWEEDIVAVSAGLCHTVGLTSYGTVVAVGDNKYGQCNVVDWTDIVAISAGGSCTLGLKSNGTVVAVGDNKEGQCNVSDWKDIVAILAAGDVSYGIKKNGTVVSTCTREYVGKYACRLSDIIAISGGKYYLCGLRKDGAIISMIYKYNEDNCEIKELPNKLFDDFNEFKKIVQNRVENIEDQISKERIRQAEILEEKRKQKQIEIEEKKRQAEIFEEMKNFRSMGVCQYCGGKFKGIFTKTCSNCGKKKDY